jgi:hypothetical protein
MDTPLKVSIRTYYGNGTQVDQALKVASPVYPPSDKNMTIFKLL